MRNTYQQLRFIFLFFSFLSFVHFPLMADTLYLLNGRSITGIIKSENENGVELEVGSGIVKFRKSEIKNIYRANSKENDAINDKFIKDKIDSERRIFIKQIEEEKKPKQVEFHGDISNIIVEAKVNKRAQARLLLDTGASVVVLLKGISRELGIDVDRLEPDMKLQLADGRLVDAKHILLNSIILEGMEAKNIEAAILLQDVGGFQGTDGLLGMSFLKRFNFKIDQREKKLILEKI